MVKGDNMLETIKNFIVNIGDILTSIWEFVIKTIEDGVYLVKLTGQAITHIPDIFSWLPGQLLALIIVLVGVVVVYKVLGRE